MQAFLYEESVYDGAIAMVHGMRRGIKRLYLPEQKLCITLDEQAGAYDGTGYQLYVFPYEEIPSAGELIGELDVEDIIGDIAEIFIYDKKNLIKEVQHLFED